ncbi:MAG TPA: sodium-dependent transporter [Oligoflexia bacterium]|nr:sodium-dependent transporter [Oligoflexia bacterium]HMP47117.1 sodium-dependent transporter [Oligoflexia bacterium]
MSKNSKEQWTSKFGVILAVAGSAVGLGNFLRFPGQAAANGGGTFMIPYIISFLILGLPICWAEWIMGKQAGVKGGFHSCPGIFLYLTKSKICSFFGAFGLLIPIGVYMYYIVIESWCLAYAWKYLSGNFNLGHDPGSYATKSSAVFNELTGIASDGFLYQSGIHEGVYWWALVFTINFILIFRGLSRGIELFCKIAMPFMALCAFIVLIRVLTLGTPNPDLPEQNVINGLGIMWNPRASDGSGSAWYQSLLNPQTWIAAAGQVFFSLSVGFGVIINYASYLKKNDDVVLSGATASATNEFFEVCLGGMITIPAAFIFLGVAGTIGGTFGLGFNTLPVVFEYMPAGRLFGFLWFFMLFLAAITSSLSMLQPVCAFFSEAFSLSRQFSAVLLSSLSAFGSLFILYFSKNLAALETIDFWVGTVGIYAFAIIQVMIFSWIFGAEKGLNIANETAKLKLPRIFLPLIRYITPGYLLIVFTFWCYQNLPEKIHEISSGGIPLYSTMLVGAILVSFALFIWIAIPKWQKRIIKEKL